MAEAFGQGGRGDERVFALAQVGVVEVDGEREQIDRDGVGEGGFEIVGLGLFVDDGLDRRTALDFADSGVVALAGAFGGGSGAARPVLRSLFRSNARRRLSHAS